MCYYSKSYCFSQNLNKPSEKIYIEPQKTQNCQRNSEEPKPSRRHNSPRLQAILQSHSNQDGVVLVSKQTDQWNRIENHEINPDTYGQLIFEKGSKNINGKKIVFSARIVGKPGQLHANQ